MRVRLLQEMKRDPLQKKKRKWKEKSAQYIALLLSHMFSFFLLRFTSPIRSSRPFSASARSLLTYQSNRQPKTPAAAAALRCYACPVLRRRRAPITSGMPAPLSCLLCVQNWAPNPNVSYLDICIRIWSNLKCKCMHFFLGKKYRVYMCTSMPFTGSAPGVLFIR